MRCPVHHSPRACLFSADINPFAKLPRCLVCEHGDSVLRCWHSWEWLFHIKALLVDTMRVNPSESQRVDVLFREARRVLIDRVEDYLHGLGLDDNIFISPSSSSCSSTDSEY